MLDARYDTAYAQWKGWSAQTFGSLKRHDRRYYAAEVRRTGVDAGQSLRVLEIGFGGGTFLAYARERGWDAIGTEVNQTLVDIAVAKGFDAKLSDDLTIFADASFDLVLAFDVLEHLEIESLGKLLDQVRRVLCRGGAMLARFPNGDSPMGLPNQNGDLTHRTYIGSGRIEQLASEAGASVAFLGGQAQPLFSGRLIKTVYRAVALPVRWLINLTVKLVILPEAKVPFCSANMVAVLRFH